MKTITTVLLCCIVLTGFPQNKDQELLKNLKALTLEDKLLLRSLPIKTIPANYASRSLPAVVDNSGSMYMRSAYNQAHYSCGQASLIGYNFTYEMARERDVPANNTDNQYPTHFTWNFMNGGDGYYGVSYLHSAQILKNCGTPNVTDYGGMAYGGYKRWMTGFGDYVTAMGNRITSISQIPVGTEEELQTLKYWLYDHLEGSESGGLASFYAGYVTVYQTLPAGTPEGGKYVLTSFGSSANHAMTIVGYHDDIKWDYNNDGQYTNDIDINNDGIVNMKDWEIGGFKMVQSYGGVPNWGDEGYAYMMYKTVADNLGVGGIWNHCVHVLDVKEEFEPELVAKVTLKHDRRIAVKVIVGFSNNENATSPEFILDSPIFDYQGGDNYMQGGTSEADKTIEFGLDLSPLLTDIELGQQARFFLQVVENDPWYLGIGEIVSFSIIDYTNGSTEITSPQSNVTIIDNDTTTVSLVHTIDFDRVEIETDEIEESFVNIPLSVQLEASGGTLPYFWVFDKAYEETNGSEDFNAIDETQLYPSNNSNGMVSQQLEFDFPFYDSTYSSITVHVDGYLMFDEQLYPYPYFNDDNVLFKVSRNISPFMSQHQQIYTSYGGGIWYEGDQNAATFRWKVKITDDYSSDLNYTVTLYPNGDIKFNYGEMTGFSDLLWLGGISDGDNSNFTRTLNSNERPIQDGYKVVLNKYNYPMELSITTDGILSGMPNHAYDNIPIKIKVTDNSFVSSVKEFVLNVSFNGEDFETGDFTSLNWGFDGETGWQIDNSIKHEGAFSARSGFITDNQSSSLIIDVILLDNGSISFFKKISCEELMIESGDKLIFLVDGETVEEWSGDNDWSFQLYSLYAGFHRLEWKYEKNSEISANMDGAWIDYIALSGFIDANPSLAVEPGEINTSLPFNQTLTDAISIENSGLASIKYAAYLSTLEEPLRNNRSVFGSYLYSQDMVIHPGESYQIDLVLYNASMDEEQLMDLAIQFPDGVELVSATDFIGTTDTLLFEGDLGNGVTATWHGEDNDGWGVLQGGQTAVATISFSVAESFTEHMDLQYEILGDNIGDEPHIETGMLSFINLGEEVIWLSLNEYEGQIEGGETRELELYFNTWEIEVGTYNCNLLIFDNFNNEYIIPVVLEVEQYVNDDELQNAEEALQIIPNPFANYTDVVIDINETGVVEIDILDIKGRIVNTLFNGELSKGTHQFRWNGNTKNGADTDSGIYICRYTQGNDVFYKRIIKH